MTALLDFPANASRETKLRTAAAYLAGRMEAARRGAPSAPAPRLAASARGAGTGGISARRGPRREAEEADSHRDTNDLARGGPTESFGEGGVVFVGGGAEYTFKGPAYEAFIAYRKRHPRKAAAYFTWDQADELAAWLDANAGKVSEIYAHSYGADPAAELVARGHGRGVRLVTVDPVGRTRPDFAKVAEVAKSWTNYNATGGKGSWPNLLAGIGGAWNEAPAAYSTFRQLPYDHADIMCAVAPAGCWSPGSGRE